MLRLVHFASPCLWTCLSKIYWGRNKPSSPLRSLSMRERIRRGSCIGLFTGAPLATIKQSIPSLIEKEIGCGLAILQRACSSSQLSPRYYDFTMLTENHAIRETIAVICLCCAQTYQYSSLFFSILCDNYCGSHHDNDDNDYNNMRYSYSTITVSCMTQC